MTFENFKALMREGTWGICTSCEFEQEGTEPDAREYECRNCGKNTVYGCEELLLTQPLELE